LVSSGPLEFCEITCKDDISISKFEITTFFEFSSKVLSCTFSPSISIQIEEGYFINDDNVSIFPVLDLNICYLSFRSDTVDAVVYLLKEKAATPASAEIMMTLELKQLPSFGKKSLESPSKNH
jgi:hypothetical protein